MMFGAGLLAHSNMYRRLYINFQNHLEESYSVEYELIYNEPNPFPLGYEPEMDVYPLLSPDKASYY